MYNLSMASLKPNFGPIFFSYSSPLLFPGTSISGSVHRLRSVGSYCICHPILSSTIILIISLSLVYTSTWISFSKQRQSKSNSKVPPTLPYAVPYIGHALGLSLNPVKALAQFSRNFHSTPIFGLKVLGHNIYFVGGQDYIAKLRKSPTIVTTSAITTFVLKTLFGVAPEALDMFRLDDSGIHVKPAFGSQIAPHNRIDHLTHANFQKHLLGESLSKTYEVFLFSLTRRLQSLTILDEWSYFPDLVQFWLPPLTSAMNESLAGPMFEGINPNFTDNLLKYYPYLHSLMKGVPSWLIPEAIRLQKDLIRDVATWHACAREKFRESDVDTKSGRDPYWGSALMREHHNILGQVDWWDAKAIASNEFGIFWGASVNVHPMAIWSIIEVFKDQKLLTRVRRELDNIGYSGTVDEDDLGKLLTSPLLQSIYLELLRLRIEVQSLFCSEREDIEIDEWRIPKGSLIVVQAGEAHKDARFWNTRSGQFPLNRFWADRFLAYSVDPQSGPRRTAQSSSKCSDMGGEKLSNDKPKLVTSGLADSFMPYGTGERRCPGRGFAKREIITFCALVVDRYDIELPSEGLDLRPTTAFYGIGTQRPRGKIPFKIRQRFKTC